MDGFSFWLSTVYGPFDGLYHSNFWQELDDLVGLGGDSWINGGDLNITRWSWEKSHDQFIPNNMQLFNQWIANYHLRDVPLENATYT